MLMRVLCRECAAEYGRKGFHLRVMTRKPLKKESCECCRKRSDDAALYELEREKQT